MVVPRASPYVGVAGDTARARPGSAAPRHRGGCHSPAGSSRPKRWLCAPGEGLRVARGRQPGSSPEGAVPGGARCRAGGGVGAADGARGQGQLFHPILLRPTPAHGDAVLPGRVCCLLRLQELGSGWTAPTEWCRGGGAEGAKSCPAWTHLGTLVGVSLLFPEVRMCLPCKTFRCPTDCPCGSAALGLAFLPRDFNPENRSFQTARGLGLWAVRCPWSAKTASSACPTAGDRVPLSPAAEHGGRWPPAPRAPRASSAPGSVRSPLPCIPLSLRPRCLRVPIRCLSALVGGSVLFINSSSVQGPW